MRWRGFLIESKSFMCYGTRSCPKWKFWLRFPRAAARFYWYELGDAYRRLAPKRGGNVKR
jgi:hypothetical protein